MPGKEARLSSCQATQRGVTSPKKHIRAVHVMSHPLDKSVCIYTALPACFADSIAMAVS
jgi:hypothetical protein